MSFWKKLFGAKQSPTAAPEPRQLGPLNGGLELPKELGPDTGTVHLNAVFAEHTRDDLLAMCRAMPIERLDFCHPGSSDLMNRAVSVSLLMVRYLAAKDKPQEYSDVLIPRFMAQLERHDPEKIHPQLAAQLEQLGGELAAGGRKNDALRCFLFLSKTLFGRTVAPRVSEYILAMRCNIALESKTREDVDAAVQLFDSLSPSQREQFSNAIAKLKSLREPDSMTSTSRAITFSPELVEVARRRVRAHEDCDSIRNDLLNRGLSLSQTDEIVGRAILAEEPSSVMTSDGFTARLLANMPLGNTEALTICRTLVRALRNPPAHQKS